MVGAVADVAAAEVVSWRDRLGECFGLIAEAKEQCGMDHYLVRTRTSWHRHITMAMYAYAFLQTTAATDPKGAADAIASARRSSGIRWA
ncbi:hypothetical protein [Glycomyces xiaoerkulensis]|uniref:hypothetical protein n=1 Tax=Glycomyces xiaoerkulensis TaxID=2038139 RepID=UPI0012FFD8D5|nr:hypothetical protein [Glycomyces xiaoerkulensis]